MIRTPALLLLAAALLAGMPVAAQIARPQNNDQPIEIIADSLEVQQDKQLAIFTGNVDAVQGDMRLKADQLKVYYKQQSNTAPQGKPAPRPAAAASDPATMNSAIERIEAFGNVFVSSSPETGKGDTGVYDVAKRTIVLEGKQVVLTSKQNVMRGKRVVMNLDTGNSTMDANPGQGERVRVLMVPEKKAN